MRPAALSHTAVRFVVNEGRVLIEKDAPGSTRSLEGLQRLRRARLRTRLSTDELLAQTRGDIGSADDPGSCPPG